jgi:hypothetical protein
MNPVSDRLYGSQMDIEGVTMLDMGRGAVTDGSIVSGGLSITSFADTIRPVAIVDTLPTLPDPLYPEFTYAVLTSDERLYKNIADVWVLGVDGADIVADSITAGRIAAGAIGVSELAAGAVTTAKLGLVDAGGTTLLDANGFGPTWQRFIHQGVYNNDFFSPPPTPASNINTTTNTLPGWTLITVGGATITVKSSTDTDSPSGRSVKFTFASGTNGDALYLQQMIPITGAKYNTRSFSQSIAGRSDGATLPAGLTAQLYIQQMKADGVTTTGSELSYPHPFFTTAANTDEAASSIVLVDQPDAAYLRVRVGAKRTATNGSTGTFRLMSASIEHHPNWVVLSDANDVTDTDVSYITRQSDVLYLAGGLAGSDVGVIKVGGDSVNGEIRVEAGTGGLLLLSDNRVIGDVLDSSSGTSFPTYTPTVTNGGSATFTLDSGWYVQMGFMVFLTINLTVNAAGSGGSTVNISLPFNADTSLSQCLSGTIGGSGTLGPVSCLLGSTTINQMRASDGTVVTGATLNATQTIRITGWYRCV